MMKNYPHYVNAWLQEHNKEGVYEISFINGGYYLYLKKQCGMKCHQYIGSIKEDGLHPSSGRNFSPASPLPPKEDEPVIPSEMTVAEFGFSKAVFHLSSETWKNSIGRDWYQVLVGIIIMISPNSYLASEGTTARNHYSGVGRQLWEHLTGISLESLHQLMGNVFLIRQDKKLYTSLISEEQASFCAKHEIRLEVV